jgi:small subunit ribosomal protein S17
MAEEEKNENVEETPAAEAPEEGAAEAPAEESPDASPQSPEEATETAEEAPAEEAAPAAEAPAADEEPEEALGPKQLRKRERSIHRGEAKPQRSAEERAAERAAIRKAKATRRSRRRGQERTKRGEPGQGTPPAERVPGTRKVQLGTVVSDKADKTITVRVDIVRRHRRYEKVVRNSATVHAHDERNEAAEGDVVRVIESRPLSRTKRWRLVEVVEKAPVVDR